MKNIFQKTKMEWMQFVLFPFKFCICLIPLVFVILMLYAGKPNLYDSLLIPDWVIHLMVGGYILCIIISAIGGIFTAVLMRNWKLMRSGLIYAGIGLFVLTYFILPSLAASRS